MKKIICILCVLACFITCFSGCGCEHTWREATCLLPQTCTQCNQTQGEALGHTWQEATCSAPKTCSTCNTTEGEPLAHTWQEATCKAPKTCSVCKTTQGKVGAHQWQAATCTTKKTCKICKKTQGDLLSHSYKNGVCTMCGKKIPTSVPANVQPANVPKAYKDILNEIIDNFDKLKNPPEGFNVDEGLSVLCLEPTSWKQIDYYIADLNGDGVKELFLSGGMVIYTIVNGKAKVVTYAPQYRFSYHILSNGDLLQYSHEGGGQYVYISYYEIKGSSCRKAYELFTDRLLEEYRLTNEVTGSEKKLTEAQYNAKAEEWAAYDITSKLPEISLEVYKAKR